MPEVMYSKELEELKEFNRDLEWFQANYEQLKRSYKGQYVAVQNRKVLGHDKNARILLRRLQLKGHDPRKLVIEFINPVHKVFVL